MRARSERVRPSGFGRFFDACGDMGSRQEGISLLDPPGGDDTRRQNVDDRECRRTNLASGSGGVGGISARSGVDARRLVDGARRAGSRRVAAGFGLAASAAAPTLAAAARASAMMAGDARTRVVGRLDRDGAGTVRPQDHEQDREHDRQEPGVGDLNDVTCVSGPHGWRSWRVETRWASSQQALSSGAPLVVSIPCVWNGGATEQNSPAGRTTQRGPAEPGCRLSQGCRSRVTGRTGRLDSLRG